jgi:hypothetical protein
MTRTSRIRTTMTRTSRIRTLALAAALPLATAAASAQTVSIDFEIADPSLLPGESTSVRLIAAFDTFDYAVAGIMTDLLAAAPVDISGSWSDLALVAPMNGPGTTAGGRHGSGVSGIIAGQLNFPPAMIYGEPQNPIAFWSATFTAPTDPGWYTVDLTTRTSRFDVYPERASARSESRLGVLVEGAGVIVVVPAPASGCVLAIGLAATRRRR